MNLAWYAARAAGLVAWALLALSVTWGFLLSTRVLGRRPKPKWLLDLHRFLGGLAVIFVAVHLVALFADSYVSFSLTQLLVPFTADYRPVAVSYGIVAFYLLVAVEVTSLVMKRLPRRVWHAIHIVSYPLFVLATVHLLFAGTDATNVVVLVLAIVAMVEATMLAVVRLSTRRTPTASTSTEPTTTDHATDRSPPAWAGAPLPAAPPVQPMGAPPTGSPVNLPSPPRRDPATAHRS